METDQSAHVEESASAENECMLLSSDSEDNNMSTTPSLSRTLPDSFSASKKTLTLSEKKLQTVLRTENAKKRQEEKVKWLGDKVGLI